MGGPPSPWVPWTLVRNWPASATKSLVTQRPTRPFRGAVYTSRFPGPEARGKRPPGVSADSFCGGENRSLVRSVHWAHWPVESLQ